MRSRRLFLICSCILLITFGSSALAVSGSFTIDQVMSAPFASSPLASPSKARVAWLLNERGQRNIYVASAPDWKGHKITNFGNDDGQEIAELAWAPDASYILFARGGDFETGGDNPNPDLSPAKPGQDIWQVTLDDSAPKKLTEGHAPAIAPDGSIVAFLRAGQIFTMKPSGEDIKNVVAQKGTASDLQWAPDGGTLAFVSGRSDHSFIGLYTLTSKSLRYLDASVDRDGNPIWSRDGTHLAYIRLAQERRSGFVSRRSGQPWSIRVADVKSGEGHEVFRARQGAGSVFHPIVSEHQVYWTADNHLVFAWEATGWCHLYEVSLNGGSVNEITPGDGEVEHVTISHDKRTLYYSTNIGDIDRRHIWTVGASGSATPKPVTRDDNIEWEPAPASDNSALVYLASSYNQRAHAVVRTADGKTTALAPDTISSDFPAGSLVHPQPVMISAADGMQIHGQVFLPSGTEGSRHPALIFFHGGSRRQMLLGFHYMYYYSNSYSLNQYLASKGYVVLSVNYRSGIGYGLNFREAINYGAGGASEYNDVIGAGLYLKSRPDVDPTRIGVWGGSYGGYLTALALARASDLFAAGVDFHGVHDWSTRERPVPNSGDPAEVKEQAEAARLAFESSPMASVKTWKSPVLLIHGDDDRNVAFSQSVMLAAALRQQHVEFEQLIFPNEIHDFLRTADWVEAYKATAAFFDRKFHAGQIEQTRR